MNLETKLNALLEQKENIEKELNVLSEEYEKRRLALIKIIGSIETINELLIDDKKEIESDQELNTNLNNQ